MFPKTNKNYMRTKINAINNKKTLKFVKYISENVLDI